jgi:hypothetical protein
VKQSDPSKEHIQRIKDSQIKFAPKYQQNRGRKKDWESSSGREAQEISYLERESDTQREWRLRRETKYDESKAKDARSAKVSSREQSQEPVTPPKSGPGANSHAPERSDISPEIRKLDEQMSASQITQEWTEAQLEFERKKAAKKAGIKVDELNQKVSEVRAAQGESRWDREWTGDGQKYGNLSEPQREWIEKRVKAEDELWNEGGAWLKNQVLSEGHELSKSPAAILHKRQNPTTDLNRDKEAMGYDINVPRCYRERARHVTEPESPEEEEAWAEVRGRPRDEWYAKHKHLQNQEFPASHHEPRRQQHQIPHRSHGQPVSEFETQWQSGEDWLRQEINKAAAGEDPTDEPQEQPPPPPPEVEDSQEPRAYSTDPVPRGDSSWRDYLVDPPYTANSHMYSNVYPHHAPLHAGYLGPAAPPGFYHGPRY